MLSYMLPVEEKSPSAAAAAAAATRNLSLNLTATTTVTSGGGGGGAGVVGGAVSTGGATIPVRDTGATASTSSSSSSASSIAQVRSIIKPTIKQSGGGGSAASSHRYQLIGSGAAAAKLPGAADSGAAAGGSEGGGAAGTGVRPGRGRPWQDEPDQCDESTNLLSGGGTEPDDDEDEEEDVRPIDDRPRAGAVKSDKNFNNLIVVSNGGRHTTNGNHAATGPAPKLASVLKPTNGSTTAVRPGSSNNGAAGNAGAYYNGYVAVSGDNDDEQHHRLLVSANNLRNTSPAGTYDEQPARPSASSFSSTARTNGNCRMMNSLNGNLMGTEPPPTTTTTTPPVVAPLPLETTDIVGAADVSLGSDSDSATGTGGGSGSATTGGGKKVKLNKLGGNKNVTLKRVSFGSSKGSMVETLVFETPTPLPEHAEREFFQSPAVLAGAGHTTVYSGGSGPPGTLVHHHYPAGPAGGLTGLHGGQSHHLPHHHHHHPYQYTGGYHPLDGGTAAVTGGASHDDSGIELQEEVERSKVRVSFFQSSKPQSISPPDSLHLYGGGQSLIQFGNGGGGYDNNNSPLDTYITSAALNQQYDSLSSHQQPHAQFHPDHRDPNMAAVYGGANVPPTAFNRQMSTESGWDNPFRPGGDLSREADEIVNLIKGGKPITPTGDQSLVNGSTPKDSHSTDDPDTTVVDGAVAKHEVSQLQATQQNGTKSPHKSPGGAAAAGSPALGTKNGTHPAAATAAGGGTDGSTVNSSTTPISNQVIPGPQSASHVVIDEKKKKKCTCCVIQ